MRTKGHTVVSVQMDGPRTTQPLTASIIISIIIIIISIIIIIRILLPVHLFLHVLLLQPSVLDDRPGVTVERLLLVLHLPEVRHIAVVESDNDQGLGLHGHHVAGQLLGRLRAVGPLHQLQVLLEPRAAEMADVLRVQLKDEALQLA